MWFVFWIEDLSQIHSSMIAELILPNRQYVLLKFFLTLIVTYISYLLYCKLKIFLRVYKLASTINGPRAYPIIGNLLSTYEPKRVAMFERKASKLISHKMNPLHEDVVRIWIFHKLVILVKDPNHAQEVLRNIKFRKNDYYKTLFADTALGEGLLTNINTETWKKQRKIITPTFHFKILHTYIKYFYEESQTLCDIISEEAASGEPVHIDWKLKLAGFDMIVRNILGIQISAQRNQEHPFLMNIVETMQLTQLRINRPWLLSKTLFYLFGYQRKQKKATQAINVFIQNVIALKRKDVNTQFAQKNNKDDNSNPKETVSCTENGTGCKAGNPADGYESSRTKSFLELLLEIGQGHGQCADDILSDAEIQRELTTLFFAALDTTSTTNETTLLLLAMHPEILKKVTAEIDSIFGGPEKDDGRRPTPDDLSMMVYLECVLKENSRLYPAGPMLPRQVDEEITLGRHLLPVGTTILVFVPALHRNRNYWHNHRQFIPDRFSLDETISGPHIAQRHPYAFVPFSAGPRNCVGQKYAMFQMKTIISTILRRFHLRAAPEFQTIRDIDKRISMDVTLRLEEGAVIFVDRKHK